MSDSEAKVIISGEAAGAIAAMQQAAAAVAEGVGKMKESLATVKESFSLVSESIIALGALAAGGGIFKEMVSATNEWVESSIHLGIELGVSTQAASAYHVAIREVGGTTGDFDTSIRGLTRNIRTHEKAMNDMRVATRASNGTMLDQQTILWNAIEAVNSYAEGEDRNLAAQAAFGRGTTSTSAILRLHKEDMADATDTAARLGLVVGDDAVEAFEKNRKALADISLSFEALKIQIGNQIIPVLIQIAEMFKGDSTTGVNFFGEALRELGRELITIIEGFELAYTAISGFGQSITAFLHGELDVASQLEDETLDKLGKIADEAARVKNNIDMGGKNFGMSGGSWDDDEWGDDSVEKKAPGKKFNQPTPQEKGPDNRMALYKNALDQMSQATGDFDKKDIAAQQQYWESILANTAKATDRDKKLRIDIEKEINTLKRKAHDEDIKSQEEHIKTVETLQLGEVAAKQQQLAQDLALGRITQAQELAGLVELANQKFAIEQKASADKLKLAGADLLAQQKLNDQELVLEQKHAAEVQKIVDKEVLEQNKGWQDLFKSMENGFASTIANFLKGTTTLAGTIKGLFQNIASSIIGTLAQIAAKKMADHIETLAMAKVERMEMQQANAVKAGSAAWASAADIPVIGWVLAPIAGAAAYAGVMAMASGGYDIPAGVNPVTQLHAQEMVLPASIANPLRNMISGGDGGGGGGDTFGDTNQEFHFHQVMPTTDQIMAHFSKAMRNGHPALRR